MLNLDIIKEIAYRANYKTTKTLLELYLQLNNSNFWKEKCAINFPEHNYLDFYAGEENYLLRKKKDFVLSITRRGYNYECENVLFEYNKLLGKMLKLAKGKFEYDQGYQFIHVQIEHRIIVLYAEQEVMVVGQCDSRDEAIAIIKDIGQNFDPYDTCMLIDMASITPYFLKHDKLCKAVPADYEIICSKDLK